MRGTCQPCNYNAFKLDGCRRGDACIFCHHCDKSSAQARKKEIQRHNLLKQWLNEAPRQKTVQSPTFISCYQLQNTRSQSKASDQIRESGRTANKHVCSEMVGSVAPPPGLTLADQVCSQRVTMTSWVPSAYSSSESSWSEETTDSEALGVAESIEFEGILLTSCFSTSSACAALTNDGKGPCQYLTLEDVLFS